MRENVKLVIMFKEWEKWRIYRTLNFISIAGKTLKYVKICKEQGIISGSLPVCVLGEHQGSVLDLILFLFFINDLNNGPASSLLNF